jgi:hypothetical protein
MPVRKGIFLGLLLLCRLSADAQTPELLIQPQTQHIDVDSTAAVQVVVNGVRELHAFSVRIAYDPLVVRCAAVRDKGFLGSMTLFFSKIDTLAGEIRVDEALLGQGGVSGSGVLLEFDMQGARNGTSALHFTTADLRDTANALIPASVHDGEIQVGDATGVAMNRNTDVSVPQALVYPNPFNPRTVVSSQLPAASNVKLVIYDMLGRKVAVLVNEWRPAGHYSDTFDATGLSSGVYLLRVTLAGSSTVTRIMLLK